MTGPLREPGWYRLTSQGAWEAVGADTAAEEIAAGGGLDLVHVETAAVAETPLF